jgi:phosphorylcholine metabolism protein LicD
MGDTGHNDTLSDTSILAPSQVEKAYDFSRNQRQSCFSVSLSACGDAFIKLNFWYREKVEREYRYQNAKGTTDAEKARIAKLAHNAMVSKDYANYSKTSSRSRNSKKKLKK